MACRLGEVGAGHVRRAWTGDGEGSQLWEHLDITLAGSDSMVAIASSRGIPPNTTGLPATRTGDSSLRQPWMVSTSHGRSLARPSMTSTAFRIGARLRSSQQSTVQHFWTPGTSLTTWLSSTPGPGPRTLGPVRQRTTATTGSFGATIRQPSLPPVSGSCHPGRRRIWLRFVRCSRRASAFSNRSWRASSKAINRLLQRTPVASSVNVEVGGCRVRWAWSS